MSRMSINIAGLLVTLASPAMAMAPQGDAQQGGPFQMMLPLLLMFGVIYFLIIRPQKRQTDKHQQFIQGLQKGDEVITSSGIIGKIAGIADATITLEIAEKTKIKVLKTHISRSFVAAEAKDSAVKAVK